MAFLVLLLLALVALFCAAGWYAIGSAVTDARRVRQLASDPAPTLTLLFDGADQVVYAPHARHGGLPLPILIAGAAQHGYRFVSESGSMATRTVVFVKARRDAAAA